MMFIEVRKAKQRRHWRVRWWHADDRGAGAESFSTCRQVSKRRDTTWSASAAAAATAASWRRMNGTHHLFVVLDITFSYYHFIIDYFVKIHSTYTAVLTYSLNWSFCSLQWQ